MSGLSHLNTQRNEIVKKWSESGLLDGLTQASNKNKLVQLIESEASVYISETIQGYTYAHKLDDSSLSDTISYFENRFIHTWLGGQSVKESIEIYDDFIRDVSLEAYSDRGRIFHFTREQTLEGLEELLKTNIALRLVYIMDKHCGEHSEFKIL